MSNTNGLHSEFRATNEWIVDALVQRGPGRKDGNIELDKNPTANGPGDPPMRDPDVDNVVGPLSNSTT